MDETAVRRVCVRVRVRVRVCVRACVVHVAARQQPFCDSSISLHLHTGMYEYQEPDAQYCVYLRTVSFRYDDIICVTESGRVGVCLFSYINIPKRCDDETNDALVSTYIF